MNKVYQVYQVSDSTGETLDRIFLAIKAQFSNFNCKTIHYSFTRTENQINKIISKSKNENNIIILYTIVDKNLAKYMKTGLRMNYEDEFRNFIGVAWADPIHGDTSYEEIEGDELVEQLCEELGIEELPDDFEWWDEYEDSGIVPQEWMDDAVDNWFGEQ